jgi:geranylgeranyl diphosphate synthase type I
MIGAAPRGATRTPVRVPSALERTRPLVSQGLRAAVERLSPSIRRIVAYHLGWLDEDGRAVEAAGGKALRPALALLSAEAVGAPAEVALAGAVALELVHNYSLIHDDVMDGDAERRHRPTVWATFGMGRAIVAGDALATLAQQLLLEDRRPEARTAAAELAAATAEMIEGQEEDLAFESRLDVGEDECLSMSGHKTGALLGAAGAIGAILGRGGPAQVGALRSFGRRVGLAFQAVDDVLGIWGEPSVTGKPAATDLRQHKKTIPVVHALGLVGPPAGELARLLSNGRLRGPGLDRAVALLEEAGSRDWTLALAERQLALALEELDAPALRLRPTAAGELAELARFVVGRDF